MVLLELKALNQWITVLKCLTFVNFVLPLNSFSDGMIYDIDIFPHVHVSSYTYFFPPKLYEICSHMILVVKKKHIWEHCSNNMVKYVWQLDSKLSTFFFMWFNHILVCMSDNGLSVDGTTHCSQSSWVCTLNVCTYTRLEMSSLI